MIPTKKHHVIPPDELPCVWMTAGVLAYQLCDRARDCDRCPLDAAIRKQNVQPDSSRDADCRQTEPLAASEALRKELRYSRNHCWTMQIDAHALRVGIEPSLSLALLSPKAIVFPPNGQHLQQRQTCLWIVMEAGTFPLESPCTGVVRRTNHLLTERPYLVHLQPFDEGWLYELGVDDASECMKDLWQVDDAHPAYAASESRFMSLLGNALQGGRPSVGVTLADGGQRLQNTADILGPSQYFAIVRKVYGA